MIQFSEHQFQRASQCIKMNVFYTLVVYFAYLQLCTAISQAGDHKILCYFQSSSWRRTGAAKFLPKNIDERLCTHIIYAFANLDNSTLTIIPKDAQTDIGNHYYERLTDFRRKGIKVIIGVGGWGDSNVKYGRLLVNETARQSFVSSVVEFVERHNFDGLDLDLEVSRNLSHFEGCNIRKTFSFS